MRSLCSFVLRFVRWRLDWLAEPDRQGQAICFDITRYIVIGVIAIIRNFWP